MTDVHLICRLHVLFMLLALSHGYPQGTRESRGPRVRFLTVSRMSTVQESEASETWTELTFLYDPMFLE